MNKYISQLSLRGKFLLIAIAMLIPIGGLSFVAVRAEVATMNVAISEDEGLDWASELIKIAANLSEYREHAMAVAAGARGRAQRTDGTRRTGARGGHGKLDALVKGDNEEFVKASGWNELRSRVETAISGDGTDVAKREAIPGADRRPARACPGHDRGVGPDPRSGDGQLCADASPACSRCRRASRPWPARAAPWISSWAATPAPPPT